MQITDKRHLDTEALKEGLLNYTNELWLHFDEVLHSDKYDDDQRLITLNCISSQCAGIFTFLAKKAGITVKMDNGYNMADYYSGHFTHEKMVLETKINQLKK